MSRGSEISVRAVGVAECPVAAPGQIGDDSDQQSATDVESPLIVGWENPAGKILGGLGGGLKITGEQVVPNERRLLALLGGGGDRFASLDE